MHYEMLLAGNDFDRSMCKFGIGEILALESKPARRYSPVKCCFLVPEESKEEGSICPVVLRRRHAQGTYTT